MTSYEINYSDSTSSICNMICMFMMTEKGFICQGISENNILIVEAKTRPQKKYSVNAKSNQKYLEHSGLVGGHN